MMPESAAPEPSGPDLPAQQGGKAGPHMYKVVSIRLRSAEFDALCEQAGMLGLTNNLALRIAARRVGGFLEIDEKVRRQLQSIMASIGEISADIRRLYAEYAKSGRVDLESLKEQRAAFGQEFVQLDALLRSILNVSQRRTDGRRALAEAMP